MMINLREFYPYDTCDSLLDVPDEIGASLGMSMNFEAVTVRYVDVCLERKKEVLDACSAAIRPQPKQPEKQKAGCQWASHEKQKRNAENRAVNA